MRAGARARAFEANPKPKPNLAVGPVVGEVSEHVVTEVNALLDLVGLGLGLGSGLGLGLGFGLGLGSGFGLGLVAEVNALLDLWVINRERGDVNDWRLRALPYP